jgi:antitoxin MazE
MKNQVKKWGNSIGLRIPKTFAKELNITADTEVELFSQDGQLIVKPIRPPKYTLSELLAGVTDENTHNETNTGALTGKELW